MPECDAALAALYGYWKNADADEQLRVSEVLYQDCDVWRASMATFGPQWTRDTCARAHRP